MDNSEKRIQKLLTNFTSASKKHYSSTLAGDWKITNSEAKKISKAFLELISFGEIGRQALLSLTDSTDLPVAAMAATYSLKYCPEKALSILTRIAGEPSLIGFQAEQAIKRWKEGNWKLE